MFTLIEKYCKFVKTESYLQLTTMKEVEQVTLSMKMVIIQKINQFIKSHFELLKLNNLMAKGGSEDSHSNLLKESTNHDTDNAQNNSNNGKNPNKSSSNNSNEIDSNSGTNSDGKKEGQSATSETRKEGKKLPKYASNMLKEWFLGHLDDPYPTKEEKIMLASKT